MGMPECEAHELFERGDDALHLKLAYAHLKEQQRLSRKSYDHSRPVDEYQWGYSVPAGNSVSITPNFSITERIECITASLPVGITSAILQLGDRQIPLLSVSAATTAQTLVNLNNLGILLQETEVRQLTFTGVATSGFYISLSGHCLERTDHK